MFVHFRLKRAKTHQPSRSGLGGKRGAGVPGYGVRGPGVWKKRGVENAGSGGKHGVSVENTGSKWKTRGLSAKHEEPTFSPNNEVESLVFQIAMKINRRETLFLVIKAN